MSNVLPADGYIENDIAHNILYDRDLTCRVVVFLDEPTRDVFYQLCRDEKKFVSQKVRELITRELKQRYLLPESTQS